MKLANPVVASMIFMERFPPNFLCHEREDPDTWAHRDAEVTALLTGRWSGVVEGDRGDSDRLGAGVGRTA